MACCLTAPSHYLNQFFYFLSARSLETHNNEIQIYWETKHELHRNILKSGVCKMSILSDPRVTVSVIFLLSLGDVLSPAWHQVIKPTCRQVSNIRHTKFQHLKDSCRFLCRIPWSQVSSREWCSWSSANRRCSNYIWVIDNFIAY